MTHSIKIWSDIVFPWVNFAGFLGVLYWFLRKPLKALFVSRSETLQKSISEAEHALREAETRFEDARKKLHQAEQEKEGLLKKTKAEIEALKRRSAQALETLIETMKAENNQKVEEEIKKAQRQLKSLVARKIIHVTEEAFKKNIESADYQRLADDFLESSFDEVGMGRISNEGKERSALRSSSR